MRRQDLQRNLDTHCQRLHAYATGLGRTGSRASAERAERLSDRLYLSHGTTTNALLEILKDGKLLSTTAVHRKYGRGLSEDSAEAKLGTADCVFLYATPFRYPKTQFGFLFGPALETERQSDGAASPFDSGFLAQPEAAGCALPTPKDFLSAHEFPIPGHRKYLRLSMENLFHRPEDYIEGLTPCHTGCLGLSGGDERQWTHEVRIPESVQIRGRHLRAVFGFLNIAGGDPIVETFLQWCIRERVDRKFLPDVDPRTRFKALQRACIDYIMTELY